MIDRRQEAIAAIVFVSAVLFSIFAVPHVAVWLHTALGATQ